MKLLLLLSIATLFATNTLVNSIPSDCRGFNQTRLINNPDNCRAYWYCAGPDSVPTADRCPKGFNFDEQNQICSEDFICDETEPPEISPPWEGSFDCPAWGVSRYTLPGSCTEYHFCFAGSHAVRECGTGLHFDSWLRECTFPETARCTRDLCPITNDIDNLITFPSQTNCEEYYMCLDGNLQPFRCAWGIHWNQNTQRCERPENAQCEVISTTWPTTANPWPPTTGPGPSTGPPTTNTGPPTTNVEPTATNTPSP